MNRKITLTMLPLLVFSATLIADVEEQHEMQPEHAEAKFQTMLEEAERTRHEAEAARLEASKAAEMARETTTRLRTERPASIHSTGWPSLKNRLAHARKKKNSPGHGAS